MKETTRLRIESGSEHLEEREMLCGSRGETETNNRSSSQQRKSARNSEALDARRQERRSQRDDARAQPASPAQSEQAQTSPQRAQTPPQQTQTPPQQVSSVSGFEQPQSIAVVAVGSDINGDGTLIFRNGQYFLAGFGLLLEGSIGSDLNGKFVVLNYDAPTNQGLPGYDVLDKAVKSDINSEFKVINVGPDGKQTSSYTVSY